MKRLVGSIALVALGAVLAFMAFGTANKSAVAENKPVPTVGRYQMVAGNAKGGQGYLAVIDTATCRILVTPIGAGHVPNDGEWKEMSKGQ